MHSQANATGSSAWTAHSGVPEGWIERVPKRQLPANNAQVA